MLLLQQISITMKCSDRSVLAHGLQNVIRNQATLNVRVRYREIKCIISYIDH